MREMFDLLTPKEKRVLQVLLLLLLVAVFFLLFFALKERKVYVNSTSTLVSTQAGYEKAKERKMATENEWESWKKAHQDMEELRGKYFYQEDEEYNRLRLFLQQTFDESRVQVSDIRYFYTPFEKENIKKVSISFNLIGSYFSLKKFINSVENLQMFLLIEKIDFIDTPAEGGSLKLKITLAGYYAS